MVYRPISEYAIIGNADRIGLIDSNGSLDWCCFPHGDSASVFARLLDAETGGYFAVRPTASYTSNQSYLDTTNVLETTFETATGDAVLTDFMPIQTDSTQDRYQYTICRQVQCSSGTVPVEVEYAPRFNYATTNTTLTRTHRSIRAVSERASVEKNSPRVTEHDNASLSLQVSGPLDLAVRSDRAVGSTILTEGESLWFVLQYNHFRPLPPMRCKTLKAQTIDYWTSWASSIEATVETIVGDNEWYDDVLRSALVLKLLINEDTGGIYAAPTTSLPEEYGCSRNWDYRYNWIRDAKFTIQALYNLGTTDEAHQYFEWFRDICHDDPQDIQPVYGVHGEREIPEFTLDNLAGYRYSSPVRIGNAASDQIQLDTYGTILQAMYETQRHDEQLTHEDWESIKKLVEYVCDVWEQKDRGIWEFREEPRHYVHSKLLCWVALDRGIKMAETHEDEVDVRHWIDERAAIREAIETRGYSESAGSFMQFFDSDETYDAACLLIPLYEFLPASDHRVSSTLDSIMDELVTENCFMSRTAGPAAPTEGRGAFLFCTFWLVDALVLADRIAEAQEIFTNVLDRIVSPSLLPERIDPETEEYLGNFPQAFSHIGLINSAVYLASATDECELKHDPQTDEPVHNLFKS